MTILVGGEQVVTGSVGAETEVRNWPSTPPFSFLWDSCDHWAVQSQWKGQFNQRGRGE